MSPTWNCVTFPRLATFGQDMRLLSVTLFSLRLGFLGCLFLTSNSCFSWWLTMILNILNANWIVWFICLAGRKGRLKKQPLFQKITSAKFSNSHFRFGFLRRLRVGPRVGNAEALGQIVARSPSKSYRFTFLMFPWVHHDCRSHHDTVLHSWWGFRLPFTSHPKNRHLPILSIPLLNQNCDHITSSKEIVAATSRRQPRRHFLKGNPRVGSFAWEEWFA